MTKAIRARKRKVFYRRHVRPLIKPLIKAWLIAGLIIYLLSQAVGTSTEPDFVSPEPDLSTISVVLAQKVEATASPKPIREAVYGKASYYSLNGCIGCREDRLMANGERLDDTKLTVAYNRALLNSYIEITNLANGKTIVAKVTDTGGFERHGKIVDLSLATKNALSCGDVCNVQIYEVKKEEAINQNQVSVARP